MSLAEWEAWAWAFCPLWAILAALVGFWEMLLA